MQNDKEQADEEYLKMFLADIEKLKAEKARKQKD